MSKAKAVLAGIGAGAAGFVGGAAVTGGFSAAANAALYYFSGPDHILYELIGPSLNLIEIVAILGVGLITSKEAASFAYDHVMRTDDQQKKLNYKRGY